MQIITGLYISVMIPLFVWFVINAIITYKRNYGLYNGVYKLGNITIWGVLFRNDYNSSGGFNKPTGCIIFVTAVYAFCWLAYIVFHFIIYKGA
jgi:L-lactate permease